MVVEAVAVVASLVCNLNYYGIDDDGIMGNLVLGSGLDLGCWVC